MPPKKPLQKNTKSVAGKAPRPAAPTKGTPSNSVRTKTLSKAKPDAETEKQRREQEEAAKVKQLQQHQDDRSALEDEEASYRIEVEEMALVQWETLLDDADTNRETAEQAEEARLHEEQRQREEEEDQRRREEAAELRRQQELEAEMLADAELRALERSAKKAQKQEELLKSRSGQFGGEFNGSFNLTPSKPQDKAARIRSKSIVHQKQEMVDTKKRTKQQLAMLECKRMIEIDRNRRVIMMQMLERTLEELDSAAIDSGEDDGYNTPEELPPLPELRDSPRNDIGLDGQSVPPDSSLPELRPTAPKSPTGKRFDRGVHGKIDTEKTEAVRQLEDRLRIRKKEEAKKVSQLMKKEGVQRRADRRKRKEEHLAQRKKEVKKQLRKLRELEERHQEQVRIEELRAQRLHLLKGDKDVLLGKKNILLAFEEKAAAAAKEDNERLVDALLQRHNKCKMGHEFYDTLKDHQSKVDARQEEYNTQLIASQNSKTFLPKLTSDLKSKARERILQEERERRAANPSPYQ